MLGDILALLLRVLLFPLRLGGAGSFPKPLSAAEERRCLELAAKGDGEARNRLIEHNLRLVAHVIKKYYSQGGDVDDLISIGVIGLIKAIRTFDMSQNTRLATYASRCVENEIFMYFRTLKRQSCEVSLSEPIDTDCEGNALELEDILSVEDDMLEGIVASERAETLRAAVASALDEREQEIIRLRYGLSGGGMLPQREVAARLGISRSYVSRIEKRALEKLRGALEK
jgi:RNA polymerase sporulation-specific sigma factor